MSLDTPDREAVIIQNILDESTLVSDCAGFVFFSVAPPESEHAKHRKSANIKDQGVQFDRLAQASVNRQSMSKGLHHTSQTLKQAPAVGGESDSKHKPVRLSIDARRANYTRVLAASQLHRIDWICEMKSQDLFLSVFRKSLGQPGV